MPSLNSLADQHRALRRIRRSQLTRRNSNAKMAGSTGTSPQLRLSVRFGRLTHGLALSRSLPIVQVRGVNSRYFRLQLCLSTRDQESSILLTTTWRSRPAKTGSDWAKSNLRVNAE